MAITTPLAGEIVRDLGGGLILRRARPDDAAQLIPFETEIFAPRAADWVAHLVRGDAPICQATDVTIVEDAATGQIVSSICLLQQHWSYDGIPFGVGQPEFVLTHPDYRSRGLVRAQMDALHEWSAARGDLVQAITGIPNYYRQFGYEMTVGLGGARIGIASLVPKLAADTTEPYRLRPATLDDVPWIARQHVENYRRRSLLVNERSEAEWRYVLTGWQAGDEFQEQLEIIEDAASGERVGFLWRHGWLRGMRQLAVGAYEVAPGHSWLAVTPSVMRQLCAVGEAIAARNCANLAPGATPDTKEKDLWNFEFFNFWIGPDHPVFQLYPDVLARSYPPYAWYIRVADLPAFLRHIAPVLERRLAASPAAGHTGDLRLSFYRAGLRLRLEHGKLAEIAPWQPLGAPKEERASALFPDLTFLHLLFGYRALDDLRAQFPDCFVESAEATTLLRALFPQRASQLHNWGSDG